MVIDRLSGDLTRQTLLPFLTQDNNSNYIYQMLRFLLRPLRLSFSKLNPQSYLQLAAAYRSNPQPSTIGEYLTAENTEALLKMVMSSPVSPLQANETLEKLADVCPTAHDEDLSLLANILKQRGINFSRTGQLAKAVGQLEEALGAVQMMENPSPLALSQIHKFIADLQVQLGSLAKAQQALREAEHLLKGLQPQDESQQLFQHSGLACIYTQLCMVAYPDKRAMQAVELLTQAEKEWASVPNKLAQEYELTCRLKCMLHVLFKENDKAVEGAQHFVAFMGESEQVQKATGNVKRQFLFNKLYYLNLIAELGHERQAEVSELQNGLKDLTKELGEEKLLEMMVMLGIKPDRYKS